ncbi:hypothetical protein DRO56_03180 [Candidatus Bathyarchaeota archaeon]|nr:MAG: hypothetical protein DRO56_03180 [Candidatus Bathyarchaeota archaeon]
MSLFDSSAIINLCGERKIDPLLEGKTLSLAFYEIGNAVWRQIHIHKVITREEGDIVLDSLMEVVRRMEKIEVERPLEILRIAVEENLTYYDASYLQAAIEKDLTLITDDKKLYVTGKKYIETLKSDEI